MFARSSKPPAPAERTCRSEPRVTGCASGITTTRATSAARSGILRPSSSRSIATTGRLLLRRPACGGRRRRRRVAHGVRPGGAAVVDDLAQGLLLGEDRGSWQQRNCPHGRGHGRLETVLRACSRKRVFTVRSRSISNTRCPAPRPQRRRRTRWPRPRAISRSSRHARRSLSRRRRS